MNKTGTTKNHRIRQAINIATVTTALIAAPFIQAEDSFELRLDRSYLSGAIELESGRVDKAIERLTFEYNKAGLAKPNYLTPAIALCAAHIMKGNGDDAGTYCNKAVEANSDSALARNNRGVFNASTGNLEAAIVDFEKALEARPYFAEAKRNLERTQARIANRQQSSDERVASAE